MREKIINILKENVDELENMEITDDTKLITAGFLESFDVINLLSIFEEEFDVTISLENAEFEDFNTIPQIVKLVEEAKVA